MKQLYLIGNAHLDPVWLWRKPEGLAEIVSTFRSALDRMKEFPGYVFTSACAGYYKWTEQIDPAMFAEIQARVAEGRWQIAGGFWVQPDCNIPSGEAFARHALYSQRFFIEKFGQAAAFGYNVDSFGHNGMMPQILAKAGMTDYVFMRPDENENPNVPGSLFMWESPDGSRVTAFRIVDGYGNWCEIERKLKNVNVEIEKNDGMPCMLFYGVGNHGGGPTIRDLKELQAYADEHDNVAFSGPKAYFDAVRKFGTGKMLPIWKTDLQHHASGCYAAVAAIKAANRRTENALVAAEKYDVMAHLLTGSKSENARLIPAWEHVMFNQFHDVLAGCCIKDAYKDALNAYAFAEQTAADMRELALQRMAWRIKTTKLLDVPSEKNGWVLWEKDGEGAPFIVFNPHSFAVSVPVQINVQIAGVKDENGNPVVSQTVRGPQTNGKDLYNTIFNAEIPAWGYATYYLYKDHAFDTASKNALSVSETSLENAYIKVVFDEKSGCITSFFDKARGVELAGGAMARPIVINDEKPDTWAHGIFTFDEQIGSFANAHIEVLERGPIRAKLRVTSTYGQSVLIQDFMLCVDKRALEVECKIDSRERLKIVKLSFPVKVQNPEATYSMPFGFITKAADGCEEPSHEWMGVSEQGSGAGLAVLNDSKYSFCAAGSDMRMAIARGAIFADHYGERDNLVEYQDQGEQSFRYALMPFEQADVSDVVKAAAVLNESPATVMDTHHNGTLDTTYMGISVAADNVLAQVMKLAEDGGGCVLRLFETAGRTVETKIDLPLMKRSFTVLFGKHEVKTLFIPKDGDIVEMDFVERKLS